MREGREAGREGRKDEMGGENGGRKQEEEEGSGGGVCQGEGRRVEITSRMNNLNGKPRKLE